MSPLKRLSLFFIGCSLVYALLIVPWPGLLDAYRACFRAGGNVLFHSVGGSAGSVLFKPIPSGDHARDTTLVLIKRRPYDARAELDIKSVYTGYRPTAFLIALVIATPIPWSRRWRALVWGLVWISAFVAFRMWLRLLDVFSDGNALAIYSFSPLWKSLLQTLVKIIVEQPETHYMAPAFIWILVAFRGGEWKRAFGLQPQPADAEPAK